MTKAEEFLALCPQPKASPVSCSGPLRATVATGIAAGRYIKGDVLTVAVWDRAKSPLVVWYFYGEEWTGTLRGNKAADRRDLRVEWVEPAQHGGSLRYREVSIMQEEERLLREYFGCTDKISPMELIYKAQNARSRRLRSERNQRQAEETRQYMNRLPPLPGDFEKRILKSCSDAVFLWFKNRKVKTILPGGEPGNMWVQDVRCDSCGGEYTTEAESLSHLGMTKCAACGKPMLAHNTRYGAKRKEQSRTFVMAQETPDGLWLRRFLVFFSFHEKKANLEVYDRDIYLIDTKRKAIHWKSEYRWQEKRSEYVMAQSAALEKMFVCSQGMYSGSAMVTIGAGTITSKQEGLDASKMVLHQRPKSPNHALEIPAEALFNAISNVLYAVSREDKKPAFGGIFFDADGATLNIVACDGYRSVWTTIPHEGEFHFILPMVAAKAIMSLGETEAVKIEASASAAYIEIGEYMMVTRLIADSFMDYKRAFLSQPPMCARLPKKETMDALRRALLATNQDKCIIMLNFDTDKCTISAKSATGNYAEDIAGNFEKLNGFDIAFNSLYLIDAIKHFDSDDLTIYFAGRLRPAQMEKDGYRALVLPVKTKEGI